MARVASQGGLGLPFNSDLLVRFKGTSRRKFLETPIGIFNGGRTRGIRSSAKSRVGAVGKKKPHGGSVSEDTFSEELERFDRELLGEVVEEASEKFETDELSCFRGLVLDLSYR